MCQAASQGLGGQLQHVGLMTGSWTEGTGDARAAHMG